jgi:hypothetical protein
MFSISGVYAQTLHAGRSLPPNLLRKALEGCLTFGREVMSLPSVGYFMEPHLHRGRLLKR